jgi:hypothetical protein
MAADYRRIPGRQLVDELTRFCGWTTFANAIGDFLAAINARAWLEPNPTTRKAPTPFLFRTAGPSRRSCSVSLHQVPGSRPFCHMDLGIEHVLVDRNVVSGVIDWGDADFADPAYDFGLLYRDCGIAVMRQTLEAYQLSCNGVDDLFVSAQCSTADAPASKISSTGSLIARRSTSRRALLL